MLVILTILLVICLGWIIYKALYHPPDITDEELENQACASELRDIIHKRPHHIVGDADYYREFWKDTR